MTAPHPEQDQRPWKRVFVVTVSCAVMAGLIIGYWQSLQFLLGPEIRLDLGSINFPTPRLTAVWNAYSLWGTIAAIVVAITFSSSWATGLTALMESRPGLVVAAFGLITTALTLAMRVFVLESAPLTDDEAAYRFAAETLRSGKLSINAPPFAAFLERVFFVVNDRVYTSYFLGWPAVLAISGLIGIEGATAALISGLCVIPLARILSRFCSAPLIVGGLVVYTSSMMTIVMGATLLTHAASTFFLLCFIDGSFIIRDSVTARARQGAWCAFVFCLAFVVRPATALAVGAPFLLLLVCTVVAKPKVAWRAALGFVSVATIGAAIFLSTNNALYGGYLETGYTNYVANIDKSSKSDYYSADRIHLVLSNPELAVRLLRAAVGRLSYDFFGWPLPFFVVAALSVIWNRRLWLFVSSALLLVMLHAVILDFGIDSFGPVHLFEAGPLLLILSCAGAQSFVKAASLWPPHRRSLFGLELPNERALLGATLALSLCAWLFYFPVRILNLNVMAADIRAPIEAAEKLEGRVAIFAPQARTGGQVLIRPLRHFVFFMPANDVQFDNRILWFRDLGDIANRQLVNQLAGRQGYQLRWDRSGRPIMVALSSLSERDKPSTMSLE